MWTPTHRKQAQQCSLPACHHALRDAWGHLKHFPIYLLVPMNTYSITSYQNISTFSSTDICLWPYNLCSATLLTLCYQAHAAGAQAQSQHNPCDLWLVSGPGAKSALTTSMFTSANDHSNNMSYLSIIKGWCDRPIWCHSTNRFNSTTLLQLPKNLHKS